MNGAQRFRHLSLLVPLAVAMLVLFIVPIGRIIATSLFDPAFTLKYFAKAFSDPIYLRVLWITVKLSSLTTAICLLLGYPMAYFVADAPTRYRGMLLALVTLSFFMSLLVKNYTWTVILQDTGIINTQLQRLGVINRPLHLMYNLFGVLVGMVHMLLPFMILPLYNGFVRMDRSLLQASAISGAGPWRTLWHVILPLSVPSIGAGVLLVYVVSLGFFVTPALLGGPQQMMLSNLVDNQVRVVLNWPFASALASVLLAVTIGVYLAYYWLFGSQRAWERS